MDPKVVNDVKRVRRLLEEAEALDSPLPATAPPQGDGSVLRELEGARGRGEPLMEGRLTDALLRMVGRDRETMREYRRIQGRVRTAVARILGHARTIARGRSPTVAHVAAAARELGMHPEFLRIALRAFAEERNRDVEEISELAGRHGRAFARFLATSMFVLGGPRAVGREWNITVRNAGGRNALLRMLRGDPRALTAFATRTESRRGGHRRAAAERQPADSFDDLLVRTLRELRGRMGQGEESGGEGSA